MKREAVNKELNDFAREVVRQSRRNLTRMGKRNSSALYRSMGWDLDVGPNSFSLEFLGADYADFVDRGVSGTQRRFDSPYRYTNKQPPVSAILPWIKSKRLRFRDEKGRFKKGSQRGLAFVIARNIKRRGIKPTLFFTTPFRKHFQRLSTDLQEAYGIDVDRFIEQTFQDRYGTTD